jgi:shikimate dehydrogenase
MITTITGATKVYGIVADPITHVKTPQAMNDLMRRRGVDGVMIPFHVRADNLSTWVEGLRRIENFGGMIVTVPHKTPMLHLCDEVTDRARKIGAVNTVRRDATGRLVADMLDGEGFVAGLRRGGIEPLRQRVYLAGAGGAANAIAVALADAHVCRLTVFNRTSSKAEELCERIRRHYPQLQVQVGTNDPSDHDLIVNATSLGLRSSDPLPLDADRLTPRSTVAEIIMQPEETPLLAAARERGCRVHPGRPMLMCQIEAMADFMMISA